MLKNRINNPHELENFVGDSPLRLMNEDIFLVILKYLTVQDYVQLSTLCHKFEQLFAQNNYLWAQVSEGFTRPFPDANFAAFSSNSYRIRPESVAKLLFNTAQGDLRKNLMNEILRLERDGMNLRNKSVVNKFDFKSALKQYHIRYLHLNRLRNISNAYTNRTNASDHVYLHPYKSQMGDVWSRMDLKKNNSAKDYYYEVDFGVNPEKLEHMCRQNSLSPAFNPKAEPLPFEIGGRLVVYKNSTVEPRVQVIMSRMPTVPRMVPTLYAPPLVGPALPPQPIAQQGPQPRIQIGARQPIQQQQASLVNKH